MTLRVSGKNLDIGDALRSQARLRVNEALSKYFTGGYSGHVTVERDGSGFRTECTLHLDSGATMHVEGASEDAYQSLNRAVERIAKQLRRYKRKRDDTGADESSDIVANLLISDADPDEDEAIPEAASASAAIIAEAAAGLPRLSTAQAVLKIESGETNSLTYINLGSKRFNLVHRRSDGHIGWVDIAAAETARPQ
jgi:ribosomal subunit interface protein